MNIEETIKCNFDKVREEIALAATNAGRRAEDVKLCAVSKFHQLESVLAAVKSKQFLFGENRVQEAWEKFTNPALANTNVDLHIIGTLQSNKVKKAVQIASCIQSVDRESILEEIEKQSSKINKNIKVFFEVHTGEDSKSGYTSEADLFLSAEKCAKGFFPHIQVAGLMTMAPFTKDEKLIHTSFEYLRNLKEKLNKSFDLPITELSMGMSGDYKIAIEEGSTIVRIGTALFGQRDYSK